MFSANSGTGSKAYRNVSVGSFVDVASPHQLVGLLFSGARAAIAEASGHLERRETAAKGAAISKAISIIDDGLKLSLDMKVGGELAVNLRDLYTYMSQRLLYANFKNDAAALEEVEKLLHQLGDAWASIATKAAKAPAAQAAPASIPAQASRAATIPAQENHHRTAPAAAQTYGPGAAGRPQAVSAAAGNAAAMPAQPAPAGAATPAGSAAPSNPTSQQSRLAAAYGVR